MAREILDRTGNEVQSTWIGRINRMMAELAVKFPAAATKIEQLDQSGNENWGVMAGKLTRMYAALYAAAGLGTPLVLDGTGNHDQNRNTARLNAMFIALYAVP